MLCLLAKVDSNGVAFDATTSQSNSNNGDQDSSITVVVQEGLEVRLPMAGQLSTVHILATIPNGKGVAVDCFAKGGLAAQGGYPCMLCIVARQWQAMHTQSCCSKAFSARLWPCRMHCLSYRKCT